MKRCFMKFSKKSIKLKKISDVRKWILCFIVKVFLDEKMNQQNWNVEGSKHQSLQIIKVVRNNKQILCNWQTE